MRIGIQVFADNGMPASQIYLFGTRMTLAQSLMLIQGLMTLSGEFDDSQLDKVTIDRINAESETKHRRVKVISTR